MLRIVNEEFFAKAVLVGWSEGRGRFSAYPTSTEQTHRAKAENEFRLDRVAQPERANFL
jgi:hypothetical protein